MATSAKAAAKVISAEIETPKKSRARALILGLLIILAGAGAGAWYFLVYKAAAAHAEKPKAAAAQAQEPVFVPMEAFTVNLQSENGEQFLQTGFTLQLADQKQVELIKMYMPHVRSRLLLLLSSKKASDILTTEGKKQLAQEIIDVIKKPFVPHGPSVNVTGVLFTSFVVQ
jgi:flagellar FliL protein